VERKQDHFKSKAERNIGAVPEAVGGVRRKVPNDKNE